MNPSRNVASRGGGVGVRNQVCSMPINPSCPTKRHLVSATKACKVVLRLLNSQLSSALGLQWTMVFKSWGRGKTR